MVMSPVSVVILQGPPVVLWGTDISPVSVETMKIIASDRFPVTSPVSVVISISPAVIPFSATSPVERFAVSFSPMQTSSRMRSPVDPTETRFRHTVLFRQASPVVRLRERFPVQVTFAIVIFPVET